jgi:nitroimidazol reductase NimA-like FMN-containing flavoprotein (pyridoxamine 5'-phosphate oxidase superfamily)
VALDATQKEKLAALLAQEHVGVLVTPGDRWPTANMQAFAETPELEILFIMGGNAEKFQNLKKHPEATVLVDTRDIGKAEAFDITRAWIQGLASEVAKGGPEWDRLKGIFLKKNPFEEPFFKNDGLRMIRIKPQRVSYAKGLGDGFKGEF